MSAELIRAIIFITSALIFYTIGVWSEKREGELKKWHVIIFYCGLVCDALGTHFMSDIAGGVELNLHGVTGLMALLLMLFHAAWATIVLIKNNPESKAKFHKFSIVVWAIWLIPYFTGMIVGMGRIH
ncbi:putative membrane protein [Clostridium baratii str. Sullivan]|uniref:Putative membrane protein n=1 Tax=Clostridium baratii str. Sullivan TaxID=1415775 RepID=A0A0A7FUI2_9CLOT|nr:HsmA family protein [Clostridium baratii]AIY83274.1 putative membrane protein [Clostridium baratii str. Sullivan]